MPDNQAQRDRRTARLLSLPSTGHTQQLRAKLRAARQHLGLTLEAVADRISEYTGESCSASSASHYEQFRRHPPIDVMAAHARAVGLRLLVDLVPETADMVAVPLRTRTAKIARALDALPDADFDLVQKMIARMLPEEDD